MLLEVDLKSKSWEDGEDSANAGGGNSQEVAEGSYRPEARVVGQMVRLAEKCLLP